MGTLTPPQADNAPVNGQAAAPTPQEDPAARELNSSLVSRNITVKNHRTSMRLEPAMWDALVEICRREKLSIHQLCDIVAEKKPKETSFTAAMRVFAMSYFRNASTEDGHSKAGHGSAFLFSAKKDFAALMQRGHMPGQSPQMTAGTAALTHSVNGSAGNAQPQGLRRL